MRLAETGQRFQPQSTRRSYRPTGTTRQRRDRATRQLIKADKERLEFLRSLSMRHAPLSADAVLWMDDLLERARLVRYHYVFKFGERTITDDLIFHHGILPLANTGAI